MRLKVIFAFYLILNLNSVFAQQNSTTNTGTFGILKGALKDSTNNIILRSATITVYKSSDNAIVSYQLSNSFGEFIFRNLPVSTPLYVQVSHVGYTNFSQNFIISPAKHDIDLKTIILQPTQTSLREVIIRLPPITMKGDTLEFNAAAFALDSNAVVEDLLRKIPNVTLWGDGMITVNGREIKNLLVNGKDFFGGNRKLILQNISKNALQSIQVYNTAKDKFNVLDSALEMNLKLRKGKDMGYFGKISLGIGSNDTYESDVSLNFYAPKLQASIVAATNNVNKTPTNIATLAENSTFKGVEARTEYQPNFRMAGVGRTKSLGGTFAYNFIEKPDDEKKSTLGSDYFVQHLNLKKNSDLNVTTFLPEGKSVVNRSLNMTDESGKSQVQNLKYELIKNGHFVTINQSSRINTGNELRETASEAKNSLGNLASSNNSAFSNEYDKGNFKLQTEYEYSPNSITTQKITSFNASYQLEIKSESYNQHNKTNFTSFLAPIDNENFNRKYNLSRNELSQKLLLNLPNAKELFMDEESFFGINFGLSNEITLQSFDGMDDVRDGVANNTFSTNGYLSNTSTSKLLREKPSFEISKRINWSLSNRYRKIFRINLIASPELVDFEARSSNKERNFKRNYSNFAPAAKISFTNYQFGKHGRVYSLDFKTQVTIPTLDQLAPLTDSTNVYYLLKGNPNLKEAITRSLAFTFSNDDYSSKNTLNYSAGMALNTTTDAIVDSLYLNVNNQQSIFLANASGLKSALLDLQIRKSIKLKKASLQLSLKSVFGVYQRPGYLDGIKFISNIRNIDHLLKFSYSSDVISLDIGQVYSTYNVRQSELGSSNKGKNLETRFSGSFNITKKLNLNSNIEFISNGFSNSPTVNFAIWNASATYRALKGNNLEFKFSGLDLLAQNKSIINRYEANSFIVGRQNVLRRYFMVNVAYYPRKFGLNNRRK